MKITRNQIRRIIREELETLSQEQKAISAEEAESAALARDRAEDITTVKGAWSGGPNLVHPTDFEAASLTGEKPVHGQQIAKIAERIIREGEMKARLGEIESSILSVVDMEPGLGGMDIINYVVSDSSDYGKGIPVTKEEVFAVLDTMLEDGKIFFDSENDMWFEYEEDLNMAREQGGLWSDEKDYEAGFYR